jgi:hypothetical protein
MAKTVVGVLALGWTGGGSVSHDGDPLGSHGGWGNPGRGFFGSCRIKAFEGKSCYVGILSLT